jgi:hypothetical protein
MAMGTLGRRLVSIDVFFQAIRIVIQDSILMKKSYMRTSVAGTIKVLGLGTSAIAWRCTEDDTDITIIRRVRKVWIQ